jgi:two-component system, probable response regulator PhcQ
LENVVADMSERAGAHTILVVDDDVVGLSLIERRLRRAGYRVIPALSGAEALQRLEEGSIDVLISDVDMPVMTGLELIARVRETHPNVARVLISGRVSLDAALTAINEGEVFRFLTKPVSQEVLLATVGEVVRRLDELRLVTSARTSTRARSLVEALEREYPGITSVMLSDGVYVIDEARIDRLTAKIDAGKLGALLGRR